MSSKLNHLTAFAWWHFTEKDKPSPCLYQPLFGSLQHHQWQWNSQRNNLSHYNDVTMDTIASQITSLTVVYSTVYSDADQRKHQSSASLAFVPRNSLLTGEFPAQMASNAEKVSIWWRHHALHRTFVTNHNTESEVLSRRGERWGFSQMHHHYMNPEYSCFKIATSWDWINPNSWHTIKHLI